MPRPDQSRKPRDDELDVFGLTHAGKVREENQDHFLVCSLQKRIEIGLTNLDRTDLQWSDAERLGVLAMVADGVGGSGGGGEASRLAVAAATRYVAEAVGAYYGSDATDQDRFPEVLEEAVQRVHEELVEAAAADPSVSKMATTLTLWIGVWPFIYLVQVGDSRHYMLYDGELRQTTRDQTVGQQLVDQGLITQSRVPKIPLGNVLASSVGGSESVPVVTRLDSGWGQVHMVCSDGLTKHVSDDRIKERLESMTSARQACEGLLQDALDDGGTDNITLIVGRAVRKEA